MLRDGIMPSPSASVINEWFKWITTNMNVSVDLIGKSCFLFPSFTLKILLFQSI